MLDRLSIPLIVFGIIGILFGICGGFFSKSHYVQKQEEQNRPQGSKNWSKGDKIAIGSFIVAVIGVTFTVLSFFKK